MPIFPAGPFPLPARDPGSAGSALDACADEPIHIPGSIQPLGALLAFREPDGMVLHASANLGEWVPAAATAGPGITVDALLGHGVQARLFQALQDDERERVRHEVVDLPPAPEVGRTGALEAVVHRHLGVCIVEVYPPPSATERTDGIRMLADVVDALHAQAGFESLIDTLVRRVRRLTGFDRVMAYRFDAQWNGHVIADDHAPGMDSLLDLHYPASDIPVQARELYRRNLVRFVADVDDPPVALRPWPGAPAAGPLDLSHAQLRSVSPVHLQYLRHMGVRSTLTLSLIVEGRLWGLVACHHGSRGDLPNRVRRVLQPLAITAGFMISWSLQRRQQEDAAAVVQARRDVVETFFDMTFPLADAVAACAGSLMGMVGASGGALWHQGSWAGFGDWPTDWPAGTLAGLAEELAASGREVLHTDRAGWPTDVPEPTRRRACGVLALALQPGARSGLVWLRPEQRRETVWGGDPDEPVHIERDAQGQVHLGPRTSFARWVSLSEGTSRPWGEVDVASARSLAPLRQLLAVREEVDQLARSDRRLRGLIDLKSEVWWRTDADGRLVVFEGPLPFDPGPVLGRSLVEVLAPWCAADALAELEAAFARGESFRALPLPARAGDGQMLVVSASVEAAQPGAAPTWQGSLGDLGADRREFEVLRRQEVARLAEAARVDFLKNLGHELRTPLHALRGYSHLLLKDPSLAPAARQRIERIQQAGGWMLEMVNDLMDMARLQTVGAEVAPRPVDVGGVLADALAALQPVAQARDVHIVVEAPPGVAAVADPVRLKRVLHSLASNAIKYNRAGGEARFVVRDLPAAGRVRVDVHDTGEGLSTEQIGTLYQAFNRLGREGLAIEGTGLGLTIARQLVQAMGGQLFVTSQPGVGSCFSVDLERAGPTSTAS